MSCNNSLHMSNDVFESVDDEPMSSRTVSADKISTITEVRKIRPISYVYTPP